MTDIKLQSIAKNFGGAPVLSDIDLDFAAGSFTALLGPSGCGKTTLLRLIAGFETPSAGEILFGTRTVATPEHQDAPEDRGVGIVFQSYALWPHMDVAQNIAYPLRARRIESSLIAPRVAAALRTVDLAGFESRRVDELSGGQRQRVALARCLVAETQAILFDEPLANLDVHLRASMIEAFRAIHQRTGATIIYVTHDQAEALALADRIAVLDGGRLQQLGTPQQIYGSPANAMVAGFVGRGSIVSATVDGQGASVAGHHFAARGTAQTGPAKLLLRPESLHLADAGIAATVDGLSYKGPVYELHLTITGSRERLVLDSPEPVAVGAKVHVAVTDAWIVPG
ncbi:MAG: spermidine/putrescine transporter ATP-binding protein [Devosia sp.]|uniref:ABC transporter ATP-binding protein n=1 Tax=Devosia sp. TaxID=1871048 RepID=UPI002610CA4E|nr:ABC transporter ATP-binding protein [Devosia sp.]MDB5529615.1 spermidine/putrescine transporter ATP-binding protein [Devosia sp.]